MLALTRSNCKPILRTRSRSGSDRSEFRIGGGTIWDGRSLYELYGEAFTPWDWQPKLKQMANDAGLALFSSPFDETAVDFLEEMDVPAL